jgi:hypothetical protein
MCHAREREHRECHDAARHAALRRSRRLPARLALALLDVPAMISGNQVRQYGIARQSRGRSLDADVWESGWVDALVGDTIQLG